MFDVVRTDAGVPHLLLHLERPFAVPDEQSVAGVLDDCLGRLEAFGSLPGDVAGGVVVEGDAEEVAGGGVAQIDLDRRHDRLDVDETVGLLRRRDLIEVVLLDDHLGGRQFDDRRGSDHGRLWNGPAVAPRKDEAHALALPDLPAGEDLLPIGGADVGLGQGTVLAEHGLFGLGQRRIVDRRLAGEIARASLADGHRVGRGGDGRGGNDEVGGKGQRDENQAEHG